MASFSTAGGLSLLDRNPARLAGKATATTEVSMAAAGGCSYMCEYRPIRAKASNHMIGCELI